MTQIKSKITQAARAGGFVDQVSGGVVPPIQPSTTFVRDENYLPLVEGNTYARDHGDQVRLAESIIAGLEEADESLLFSSGMAAIAALFAILKPGDCLLLQSDIYWGTTVFANRLCEHYKIDLVEEDASQFGLFSKAIEQHQPKLIFIETPSNPWIKISDVRALSSVAHKHGALLAVDATAATPLLMPALTLGADLAVHSATKILNGHSDVLAGVISCKDSLKDDWQIIRKERMQKGAVLSPNSAWLLIRGMRTLPLRLEQSCKSAVILARYLEDHPCVEEVWYPGLSSHKGHELARSQMDGHFGYLMSFLLKGGEREALAFCSNLKGIARATSIGGVESLVEHRYSIEKDVSSCPPNLIRLSVGIEDVDDLLAELEVALKAIQN